MRRQGIHLKASNPRPEPSPPTWSSPRNLGQRPWVGALVWFPGPLLRSQPGLSDPASALLWRRLVVGSASASAPLNPAAEAPWTPPGWRTGWDAGALSSFCFMFVKASPQKAFHLP